MPESTPPPDTTSPLPHDAYTVATRIAIGHAGIVYRAVQNSTGREVILKVLAPHSIHPLDPEAVSALMESVKRVQHPCVAEWIDASHDPDGFLIVHEYREGIAGNLVTGQRKFEPAEGRLLAVQLLGALLAGEQAKVPHGDIKPSNIVISNDPEKGLALMVLDWGLSTCREHHPNESLLFMAPERLQGESPSVSSDLFSAGATLTFLLTGCYPVHGFSAEEVLAVWQRFDPATIRIARPDLDEHFCNWLGWLLRLKPEDRPATATQAREALEPVPAITACEENKTDAPAEIEPAIIVQPQARQFVAQRPVFRPPGAAARIAQVEVRESVPEKPRPRKSKITLGLLVICSLLATFAGFGWWAVTRHGSGGIGEWWHSKSKTVVATPTKPKTSVTTPAKPETVVTTQPKIRPKRNARGTPPTAPTPSPPPAPTTSDSPSVAAREPFNYPPGPKLDGLAGGGGWAGAWRAINVSVAQSQDKKSIFAQIGRATSASATRVFAPFSKVSQKGVVLAFNLSHPGVECTALTIETLGNVSGKEAAPLSVAAIDGAIQFSLGGESQKLKWPGGKMVRVVMQWDFKQLPEGKYDVTVRAWLNPEMNSKTPFAKAPATSRLLKGIAAPSEIVFSITAPAGSKRGAMLADLRMASTIQEAMK